MTQHSDQELIRLLLDAGVESGSVLFRPDGIRRPSNFEFVKEGIEMVYACDAPNDVQVYSRIVIVDLCREAFKKLPRSGDGSAVIIDGVPCVAVVAWPIFQAGWNAREGTT